MMFKIISRFSSSVPKPFSEIPTPPKWPLVGHVPMFIGKGPYTLERLPEAVEDLSSKYGPIFCLQLGEVEMVVTVDPEDACKIFRNEGRLPNRLAFPALLHLRKKTFGSVGIIPGNGEEWHFFRTALNPLLKPQLMDTFVPKLHDVTADFITFIEENKSSDHMVVDILSILLRHSIAAISVVSPGVLFPTLSKKTSEKAKAVVSANCDLLEGMYKTLIGLPLWKLWKTKAYKQLEHGHATIYNSIKSELQLMRNKYDSGDLQNSLFMEKLFSNKSLTEKDQVMLAMEVFMGAIDSTSTTAAMMLYYLSKNEDCQNRAYEEAKSGKSLRYISACFKETLRLSSPAVSNGRFLMNDTVIGGYNVPSGKLVLSFHTVTGVMEKYFKNAKQFQPERWLRDEKMETAHPFASLPFGFGPRMCPGKRFAEHEVTILVKMVLLKYYLKDDGNPNSVGMIVRMNRIPDRKINLRFIPRN